MMSLLVIGLWCAAAFIAAVGALLVFLVARRNQ